MGGVTSEEDIVDQALDRFKVYWIVKVGTYFVVFFTYLQANILFKQFELETTVDRVLVYVTLYIVGWVKFYL